MSRWRAGVAIGALALALGGCSVELVDDKQTSGSTKAPAALDPGDEPLAVTTPSAPREDADARPGEAAELPSRDDLRELTTGQTACGDGDVGTDLAGAAVEITDRCVTLTVGGADSVVVAQDVRHLIVTGAGSRVAVQSVATVTISAAGATVTWEEGTPTVTDDGAGSTYGVAGTR